LGEQGIKFYEPEVVGDTPETVELVGVRNLLAAAAEHLGFEAGRTIFSTDGSVGQPSACSSHRSCGVSRHLM
jgi:hypothetical protein